ncbi:phage tail tape measure protein [Paenibacillus gallinarum]|uniref:Phage tail tape measure protein n=1 Tax=Paenibacillus gallinarum TaxID=2762232 RepID=A0ABR8SXE8_9BACL|nr:phage tail tape measure protein [Paenibacillus gallinarum]MBD7967769.1 phage tail tape measure protein [Paenibacillus gallinarum]
MAEESMEVANLVTRLSLEDSGVNKSIAALDRQMKLVQTTFEAASTKLEGFGDAEGQLKVKTDALNAQMKIQQQRIDQLKQKHEELAKAKGLDARETQNLEVKLNKAITAYNKMGNELSSMEKKVESQTTVWNKLSSNLDSIQKKFETIGQNMSQAGQAMSLMITAPLVGVGAASTKASIDFETAFAGVKKTVDATEEELADFEQGILDMSREIPTAATAIAAIAESAGQLGIKNEALMDFTRIMADVGVATNMSSDQAATALARLANITQMPQDNFDRLASTIVALGNTLAATESEITDMALRLAGAGNQIGMTEDQIVSFAGALSSVGIQAEMGGSAFSRVMVDMAQAVQTGGAQLNNFSMVAGMTADQFKEQFKNDAAGALVTFIEGLGRMSKAGENTFAVLDAMKLSEVQVRDALLRASGAGDLFRTSLEQGSKAWEENTALTNEANAKYEISASQLQILKNNLTYTAITLGGSLVPALLAALEAAQPLFDALQKGAESFAALDSSTQTTIIGITAFAAILGPALILVGQMMTGIASLIPLVQGLGVALRFIATNPIALALTAAAAGFALVTNAIRESKQAAEELKQAQEELQAVQRNGIDRSEIAATEEKIQKINELIESYEKLIEVASSSDSAKMGNNIGALDGAAEDLNISLKDLQKTADEFGITLEFIDENGKIATRSMKELKNAYNILSGAIHDAQRLTTTEINDQARKIAVRKQEVNSISGLIKTYQSAAKGSDQWTLAQNELINQFPQFVTATGINVKAIEGLILVKEREIELEWANIQMKAQEALQEKNTAVVKQQAAIAVAESINKITGASGLAESALAGMNAQLERLRGEAAALQSLVDMKPTDFKLSAVPKISTGSASQIDFGKGAGVPKVPAATKKKSTGKKSSSSGATKAYENKGLDEAYKQLEHKKHLDQLTLASELSTLEAIKSKHVKTADERMEIEERIYDVKKALGDKSLDSALKDYERAKDMGKLSENDEINRLKRIRSKYADSAEERERIDDMIYEATKRKVEAEKELRKSTTEYVSQQLQAAYEDRLAREELTAEQRYKLEDKLINDQMYLNNNYLQKVLKDNRYSAAEKKEIEREITEEIRKQKNERLLLQREYNEEVKKLLEEEKKARIDSVNNLSKGVQDALKAQYQEEKRINEDRIKESISANDTWKNNQLESIKTVYDARVAAAQKAADQEIERINSVYNAQIEAIQAQLEAMDQAEKQKSREELDADDAKKISKLTAMIEYEHDDQNKAQLEKELNKVIADQNERHRQEQLQDTKDSLKAEQQSLKDKMAEEAQLIKDNLAWKKEVMQANYESEVASINAVYEQQKNVLNQQLLDTQAHYDKLLESKNIQAEAEKMIVQNQQKEIIKLLEKFGDSYAITGQTLGEKMYDAFAEKVSKISTLIAQVNSQIDAARNAALAVVASASTVNSKPSSGTTQTSGKVTEVAGTVVRVTNNFNSPVTSPSDVSRASQRVAQALSPV